MPLAQWPAVLLGLFILIVWQYATEQAWVSSHILPSLFDILSSLARAPKLWLPHLQTTVMTAAAGLSIAVLSALVLGVLMSASKIIHRMIYPWLIITQSGYKFIFTNVFISNLLRPTLLQNGN